MFLKTLLLAAVLCSSTHAAIIAQGSLTDPSGDHVADQGGDFISLFASVDSNGSVLFQARFASGTYLDTSRVGITLDTDRNPATGFPGINSGNSDSDVFGTDFLLLVGSSSNEGHATLLPWLGANFGPETGPYSVTYLTDGLDVNIPLADIGGDPLFYFKGTVSRSFSEDVSTAIGDYISDIGQVSGSTEATIPEPSSFLAIGAGLGALAVLRRRSR